MIITPHVFPIALSSPTVVVAIPFLLAAASSSSLSKRGITIVDPKSFPKSDFPRLRRRRNAPRCPGAPIPSSSARIVSGRVCTLDACHHSMDCLPCLGGRGEVPVACHSEGEGGDRVQMVRFASCDVGRSSRGGDLLRAGLTVTLTKTMVDLAYGRSGVSELWLIRMC